MRVLAIFVIIPAGATLWFFTFWHWFEYWKRHLVQTYALLLGMFITIVIVATVWRDMILPHAITFPLAVRLLGWVLVAAAGVLGFVADRQIGIRVRWFMPFFEAHGRIRLHTSGAYGIVRHPIYAAVIGSQLGVFLVTGYPAVLAACVVLALGALWFTRQEERHLIALLDDPAEYERYRAEGPALLPWRFRRRT